MLRKRSVAIIVGLILLVGVLVIAFWPSNEIENPYEPWNSKWGPFPLPLAAPQDFAMNIRVGGDDDFTETEAQWIKHSAYFLFQTLPPGDERRPLIQTMVFLPLLPNHEMYEHNIAAYDIEKRRVNIRRDLLHFRYFALARELAHELDHAVHDREPLLPGPAVWQIEIRAHLADQLAIDAMEDYLVRRHSAEKRDLSAWRYILFKRRMQSKELELSYRAKLDLGALAVYVQRLEVFFAEQEPNSVTTVNTFRNDATRFTQQRPFPVDSVRDLHTRTFVFIRDSPLLGYRNTTQWIDKIQQWEDRLQELERIRRAIAKM